METYYVVFKAGTLFSILASAHSKELADHLLSVYQADRPNSYDDFCIIKEYPNELPF